MVYILFNIYTLQNVKYSVHLSKNILYEVIYVITQIQAMGMATYGISSCCMGAL
jgi:hypothetical protein